MAVDRREPGRSLKGGDVTKTKIDWADYTWNPVWGCEHNCPYCYARALAHRFGHDFKPTWKPPAFASAMPREPGQLIFVNSMSDVAFWKGEWLLRVVNRIAQNPQHRFLFLTKAPRTYLDWWQATPDNVWFGVSASTQPMLTKAAILPARMSAAFTVLSAEPLHGRLTGAAAFNWVIIGAETGTRKERIEPKREWIQEIIEECTAARVPVWMKNNLRAYWTGALIQQRP